MSGDQTALSGQRVLIVDDEYAFAYEMADTAAKLGARIPGPLATVAAACAMITPGAQIDLMLLDLHLQGEMAWPALDLLAAAGHSGRCHQRYTAQPCSGPLRRHAAAQKAPQQEKDAALLQAV
jgi:CheY-like chemotaxis protein